MNGSFELNQPSPRGRGQGEGSSRLESRSHRENPGGLERKELSHMGAIHCAVPVKLKAVPPPHIPGQCFFLISVNCSMLKKFHEICGYRSAPIF
jgi:hypothetical protein